MIRDFSSAGFWLLLILSSVLLAMSSDKKSTSEPKQKDETEVLFCTMDVKECPDGTYVGRDPKLNCEFPACPQVETK